MDGCPSRFGGFPPILMDAGVPGAGPRLVVRGGTRRDDIPVPQHHLHGCDHHKRVVWDIITPTGEVRWAVVCPYCPARSEPCATPEAAEVDFWSRLGEACLRLPMEPGRN